MKKLKNDLVLAKKTNLNENKKHGTTIWSCFTWLVFFISMVACFPPTTSDGGGNGEGSKTFTYPPATFGKAETIFPSAPPSQATGYRIDNDAVEMITPPTINPNTGEITTTATTTAGVYSVIAFNGSDEITNVSFTVTYIATNKAALESEVKSSTATGRAAWGDTGNFNYIDTSMVTDMQNLFQDDVNFNGDISNWDVSNVMIMQGMFTNAAAFNQDLSSWDVSSVTNMQIMFQNASDFNQDLEAWGEHLHSSVTVTDMFSNSNVKSLPTWCSNRSCQ